MKNSLVLLGFIAGISLPVVYAEDSTNSGVPKVRVVASDPTAFEGLSSGAFNIYRRDTNGNLAVDIRLSGTASNGVDYVSLPNSITIPAGLHSIGLVVEPIPNPTNSSSKRVELTILSNANYKIEWPRSAVVTINQNFFENAAPSVTITNPVDNTVVGQPVGLVISATASDPDGAIKSVSFFANDHLIGNVKTSPYSLTWSNATAGTYALFARAEDLFGKSTVSAPVHVTVTNGAPAIHITSPTDGEVFGQPADIKIEAETSGGDAAVKRVTFYAGDHLLGSISDAPYSLTWSNAPRGHFSLVAKLTDTSDEVAYSQKVGITVSNQPPAVEITEPAENAVFATGVDVAIKADASDPDGSVENVMFFDNTRFLGTVKTAPYSLTWSNIFPGKHTIIARAVDLEGLATVSTAVHVVVSNSPPTVVLTAPADGSSFAAPATIELKADASDPDGIRAVSFWSKDHVLGYKKDAPYTLTLENLKAGDYEFTALALDKYEQRAVSAPIHITVTNSPTAEPLSRN